MLQDRLIIQQRHQQFIDRIAASGTVWALSSEEGWAVSGSHADENTDIILFWSDEAYARAVAKEDWSHYQAVSIPLAEFLENWLVGMYQNGVLAGTNWDANMFGEEAEPLKLVVDIFEAVKQAGTTLPFTKYTDLADFEQEVRKAIEQGGETLQPE
jgi:hypothetical protein